MPLTMISSCGGVLPCRLPLDQPHSGGLRHGSLATRFVRTLDIDSAVRFVRYHRGSRLETTRNERILRLADTHIADELPFPAGPAVDWRQKGEGRVLLTGVTGFLGMFLLADLLKMPDVHQVACLVRVVGAATARQRLQKALIRYQLWQDGFALWQPGRPVVKAERSAVLRDSRLGQPELSSGSAREIHASRFTTPARQCLRDVECGTTSFDRPDRGPPLLLQYLVLRPDRMGHWCHDRL